MRFTATLAGLWLLAVIGVFVIDYLYRVGALPAWACAALLLVAGFGWIVAMFGACEYAD